MILSSAIRNSTLLLFLVIPANTCWSQTYNVAADFEKGWTAQKNPNGVWSYGYSSGFTSPITLYSQTAQNGVNGPDAQYWLSPAVDVLTSPAAEFNDGPAYDDGNVDFLANEFVLVAGVGGQYSDLVFTAPVDGIYSLASSFRGDQYNIGTVVAIVADGSILFASSITTEGQTEPFNTKVFLKSGHTIVFSVGPAGGHQNTGLSATITKIPCTLQNNLTYNPTLGTLTSKFTIENSAEVTWNAWLTYQDTIEHLFTTSQPITTQPKVITKMIHLPKEGTVGVLSTFVTPEEGITCSSWVQINTGTGP